MNYLDIVITIALIYGLIKGFANGFIKEITGLLGLIIGAYVAINFSSYLHPKFEEFSTHDAFKDIKFCKITMDELENDNDESEIKSILNLEGKKYPQIVFLQQSQVLYQLEYLNFEKEFQNIMLLFI